jgi:lipopolysaccharide export LptBFGC system permease protein LptF
MLRLIVWLRFMKYKALRNLHKWLQRRSDDGGYASLDAYLLQVWSKFILMFLLLLVAAACMVAISLISRIT